MDYDYEIESREFMLGYKAGLAAVHSGFNPFDIMTLKWKNWKYGWECGMLEFIRHQTHD